MQKEKKTTELMEKLEYWKNLGLESAEHIRGCKTCLAAEEVGGKGYCITGDKLWGRLIGYELKIITEIIPEMRALGIDVDKAFQGTGFKFIVETKRC